MKNRRTILTLAYVNLLIVGVMGCDSVAPPPTAVPTPAPQVVMQGSSLREEIQIIELSGCGGKADIKRTEKRSRSVDLTISAEVAAKVGVSVQIINAEVQAAVGVALKRGEEKETAIELVAPPNTRMVFQVVWIGEEQIGILQYLRGSDLPIAFRSFKPNDVRVKSSQDIGCEGNAPIPLSSPEAVKTAPPIADNLNCEFINELINKSQVDQVLTGGNGAAGVQARLVRPIDVPIGWTVHNQGVAYNGPVRFESGTFASFWAPNQCEPLNLPLANQSPSTSNLPSVDCSIGKPLTHHQPIVGQEWVLPSDGWIIVNFWSNEPGIDQTEHKILLEPNSPRSFLGGGSAWQWSEECEGAARQNLLTNPLPETTLENLKVLGLVH